VAVRAGGERAGAAGGGGDGGGCCAGVAAPLKTKPAGEVDHLDPAGYRANSFGEPILPQAKSLGIDITSRRRAKHAPGPLGKDRAAGGPAFHGHLRWPAKPLPLPGKVQFRYQDETKGGYGKYRYARAPVATFFRTLT